MTVLWILIFAVLVLGVFGGLYSRVMSRWLGESASRPTPAILHADGRDYVPTPTPVVFAHHFASIAGAGPIVGPVIAMAYGWLPAVLWVVFGGVFIGAVHDYLATYMATREGGQSMAVIARRLLGRGPFLAMMVFLVVMLALVCAMFLNLSATALTSMVEMSRLGMTEASLFRVVSHVDADGNSVRNIVIGGVASMSVVVITACAPLVGWLYIKKQVAVWKCSVLAVAICAVSIVVGVLCPISFGDLTWKLLLSAYVLIAAGVPVWLFLQSRDFINVHILYVGMIALIVILVAAGVKGVHLPGADQAIAVVAAKGPIEINATIQPFSIALGEKLLGPIWPVLFITIACGAVSGFHSLCAGGTTSKQLTSERAARHIGYYGMLLESLLAVCVIAVCLVGLEMGPYLRDVFPRVLNPLTKAQSNPTLAFGMAVGWTAHLALNVPIVVGALVGMVLLEGFLVTTLDTAVRLTRYLLEEIWRTLFGGFDVFAEPVGAKDAKARWSTGSASPAGADGLPVAPAIEDQPAAPEFPTTTTGAFRTFLQVLRQYWVNSGLAVALMLAFAMTGGALALWGVFATANQLLAAMVLALAALWLLRQKRRSLFALIPALFMLATTTASLYLTMRGFLKNPAANVTLLTADIIICVITVYLLIVGATTAVKQLRNRCAE